MSNVIGVSMNTIALSRVSVQMIGQPNEQAFIASYDWTKGKSSCKQWNFMLFTRWLILKLFLFSECREVLVLPKFCKIVWRTSFCGMCSKVFLYFTLKLPIQTLISVAPVCSVFWCATQFQQNEHIPGTCTISPCFCPNRECFWLEQQMVLQRLTIFNSSLSNCLVKLFVFQNLQPPRLTDHEPS